MRIWTRTVVPQRCGRCGTTIAVGAPVQQVRLAGVMRTKIRCGDCAEGPIPPDLPLFVERLEAVKPLQPLQSLRGMLPLDWKTQGAGDDREPGMEG